MAPRKRPSTDARGPARKSVVEKLLVGWHVNSTFGGRVRASPPGAPVCERTADFAHGIEFQGVRHDTGLHGGRTRCEVRIDESALSGASVKIEAHGDDEREAFAALFERIAGLAQWFGFRPPPRAKATG